MIIRELGNDDAIPPIPALLHAAYAPLAKMGLRFLATHQDDATTLNRFRRGFGFVAEIDGAIVGTITLYPPATESECPYYLSPGVFAFGQFGVRPDYQRRGVGRQLLKFIEQKARERGAVELALDTAEGALHLRQWYERCGFRAVGHVSWHDTNYRSVVLSKIISAD